MAWYAGRPLRDCGGALLVDISEILFNELVFFHLMQDLNITAVMQNVQHAYTRPAVKWTSRTEVSISEAVFVLQTV